NYLDAPLKDALLASLLDSRFKKMNRWPDEIRISTISLLRKEYLLIKGGETTTSQRNTRSVGRFESRLFGSDSDVHVDNDENDEINCYLDNIKTPQAIPETDPFQWWVNHKQRFPILYKIARKYLSIPATFVPSEQLFNEAGK